MKAAERVIVKTAGLNMNTWVVGNAPIGHYILKPKPASEQSSAQPGEKTFFMKGRIMAGQADLAENIYGLSKFMWLTREEIERKVSKNYFTYVKDMLAER